MGWFKLHYVSECFGLSTVNFPPPCRSINYLVSTTLLPHH